MVTETKIPSYDSSLFTVKCGVVYTCPFCEYVFYSKHCLTKHKRLHNFCRYCKSRFKNSKSLNKHKSSCLITKCLTSRLTVQLIDIAFSKKVRSTYKTAFSAYPDTSGATSESTYETNNYINKEAQLNSMHSNLLNICVKTEPVDIDETEPNLSEDFNCFETEISVKSEMIDCMEEQFSLTNSTLNHVEVETNINNTVCLDTTLEIFDYPSENYISSKLSCTPLINYDNKENICHETENLINYYSSDDESEKTDRYSRFKSESRLFITEDESKEDINQKLNIIKEDESIKTEEVDAVIKTEPKDLESKPFHLRSCVENQLEQKEICTFKTKIPLQCLKEDLKEIKLETKPLIPKEENKSISTKIPVKSTVKNEIFSSDDKFLIHKSNRYCKNIKCNKSPEQRVRFIHFTNIPNLNLFLL